CARRLAPVIVSLVALSAAAPALAAAKRMVTYDSASPEARRLTGAGLTFVFTKTLLRQRVLAVRATAVPVGVVPEPLRDGEVVRVLDGLMGEDAGTGTLYEIAADKAEGRPSARGRPADGCRSAPSPTAGTCASTPSAPTRRGRRSCARSWTSPGAANGGCPIPTAPMSPLA
ncbi:MAG TPA: hypothetical protein PLF78_02430, partial [Caulobacter sp.]|nr:hypothetical protein [Caulobacter sp.]